MACGVYLGILLLCLVEAELVRSSWAAQDRRPNVKTHIGFSQQGGFGGTHPQNQLRQASGSPQSSAKSKPNRPTTKSTQENVQKKLIVASGGSLGKYAQTPIGKKRTRPAQQGTPSTGAYQSSSSGSLQSPRGGYSFKPASRQSAAQRASAVSGPPGQGYPKAMKSSSLFSKGAAGAQRIPGRTRTSASGAAVKVSPHRGPEASKPSYFSSLQNKRSRHNPSRAGAGNPNKRVPVTAPNPPASGTSGSGQKFAPTRTHNIPQAFGGSAIRRLKEPQKEGSVGKPQQTYVAPQRPLTQKQTYVAPQQPLTQKQTYVAPQQPLTQKQTYVAPQRTLTQKRPLAQKQTYVAPQGTLAQKRPLTQKQTYVAPQRTLAQKRPLTQKQAYVAPQQTLTQKQAYVAPQQTLTQKRPLTQKQAYVAPQRTLAQKRPLTQKQPYVAPPRTLTQKQPLAQKQASVAPQRPSASYEPQAQTARPEAQWMRVSSRLRQ